MSISAAPQSLYTRLYTLFSGSVSISDLIDPHKITILNFPGLSIIFLPSFNSLICLKSGEFVEVVLETDFFKDSISVFSSCIPVRFFSTNTAY